jgi:hypothetical protein
MDRRQGREDDMAQPMKVPEQETPESYVARIRELIDTERVRGARKLMAEAWEAFPDHPALIPWKKALALPELVKVGGPLDKDRTPEYNWLAVHGPKYMGEWVAVLEDRLVAHAPKLKDLNEELDRQPPTPFPPLVVKIEDLRPTCSK